MKNLSTIAGKSHQLIDKKSTSWEDTEGFVSKQENQLEMFFL